MIPWESIFIFDMVVFVLTFVKTFRERKRTVAGVTSVQDLMLRDGKAVHTTASQSGALRLFVGALYFA